MAKVEKMEKSCTIPGANDVPPLDRWRVDEVLEPNRPIWGLDTGNLTAFVDQRAAPIAERAASRMGQQIDRALPMRVQQINAQPRRR